MIRQQVGRCETTNPILILELLQPKYTDVITIFVKYNSMHVSFKRLPVAPAAVVPQLLFAEMVGM